MQTSPRRPRPQTRYGCLFLAILLGTVLGFVLGWRLRPVVDEWWAMRAPAPATTTADDSPTASAEVPTVPPVEQPPTELGPSDDAPLADAPLETPPVDAPLEAGAVPTMPPPTVPGLAGKRLTFPVPAVRTAPLDESFDDPRGGSRRHEGIDILAPRDSPIVAVDDGRIVKLFDSKPGGLTVYHFDPSQTLAYYYAHLERYAPGLEEGDRIAAGQILGYVGTSGNAPKDTPHLHFAIYRLGPEKRWWEGTPLNPYGPLLAASRR